MTDFAALVAGADAAVFGALADLVTLNGTQVRGMYRAPWQQPDLGTLRTGLVEPVVVVREGDALSAAPGSTLAHAGRSYTVVAIEPDGTGLVALVLREVAA